MLNRIYIILGLLAIVLLIGAFVVPRFVDWSNFRDRMQAIAVEALGTEVEIRGDIDFTLLPQPSMSFNDVLVGPAENPIMSVTRAEAHFSLLDFLRDRYFIQQLVLDGPELNLQIGKDGALQVPIDLPEEVRTSNVSIENATIQNGTIRLDDFRSGQTWRARNFNGALQLSALRGPFALQGTANIGDQDLNLRVTTSTMNADGLMTLTSFIRPTGDAFSLSLEGQLSTGPEPKFTGDLVYRASPKLSETSDVEGDFVFEGKVEASTAKALVTSYTIVPDENRSATRLTGHASVTFGEEPEFEALVFGGVFGLAPRDATTQSDEDPLEFVRLLKELPTPFIPSIPGTLGVEISELDLRALSMRDLSFGATTDGKTWQIDDFAARLAGDTKLSATGTVSVADARPLFKGNVQMQTRRLDALAQLWRRPVTDNPLFNLTARLTGDVELTKDALKLDKGVLTLAGVRNEIGIGAQFGAAHHLDVSAKLGGLDTRLSSAVAGLFPVFGTGTAFDASFVGGSFDLAAASATINNVPGTELVAKGAWNHDGLTFDRLSATDLGGASIDAAGFYATVAPKTWISGSAHIGLGEAARDGLLAEILPKAGLPDAWTAIIDASLPADLDFALNQPDDNSGQTLLVSGTAAALDLDIKAGLAGGFLRAINNSLVVDGTVHSEDPTALTAQLGLGDISILPDGEPATVSFKIDGAPLNSVSITATAEGGGDHLGFTGNLIVSTLDQLRGNGKLDFALSDPGPLAALFGADGIYVPAIAGTASVTSPGPQSLSLTDISLDAGGTHVTGGLTRLRQGAGSAINGDLQISALDLNAFVAVLGGASATLPGDGLWPNGPMSDATADRDATGRISVGISQIALSPTNRMTDAEMNVSWDRASHRISGFRADFGGGTIGFNAVVCCASAQVDRTISGNISLNGVALANLLPPVPAGALQGTVDISTSFDGTGPGFGDIAAVLAGQGSFTLHDLAINGFSPSAFQTVATTPNVQDLDTDALATIISMALQKGQLVVPEFSGTFTLAGGKIRTSNLAASNENAQLVGDLDLDVTDMGLDGAWRLSPIGGTDPAGLISDSTSEVTVKISGTLMQPVTELDVQTMVDDIQVRALALELERLEKLRAEDEARARAAAEERARLMEMQAKKFAEQQAAKAIEDGTLTQEDIQPTSPPPDGLNSLFQPQP